jgi:hypothetical protein
MKKNYLLFLLLLVLVSNIQAQTRYVDASRASSGAGTSWATAYKTLNEALDNVHSHNAGSAEIYVAAGTYYPTGQQTGTNRDASFVISMSNLKLYGGFPPGGGTRNPAANKTIMSGEINNSTITTDNSYHVLIICGAYRIGSHLANDSLIVDGFSIQGGRADGSGRVDYNQITITRDGGGGIFSASDGPAFTLRNCIISGNYAADAAAGMYNSNSQNFIVNCVFSGNYANYGGAMINTSNATTNILNCTIAGNHANGSNGGGIRNSGSNPSIVNTIICGNNGGGISNNNSSPVISFSMVQEHSSTSNGNVNGTADPLFVNPVAAGTVNVGGDYRLQNCSPAINVGDKLAIPNGITTDLVGNTRIFNGGVVDMGAYENNASFLLYVREGGAGDKSGSSWENASDDLQAVIIQSCSNTEIRVAAGTYYPTGAQNGTNRNASFTIYQAPIKLYGGYPASGGNTRNPAANPTILSGEINNSSISTDNSYHVLVITGLKAVADSAVVDGFSIQGGRASGSGSFLYNNKSLTRDGGGGIFIADNANGNRVTIRNCIIEGNYAVDAGAGMYNSNSSILLVNCLFRGNVADYGGAMINTSNAQINIINCTIAGNKAGNGNGGGMRNSSSNTIITNTIIYGNNGGGISNNSSTPVISYSLVQGLTGASNGNINGDLAPLFVNPIAADAVNTGGDYRLLVASPCINVDNNAVLPSGIATDLDGNQRIYGALIDMGAFELQDCPAAIKPAPPTVISPQAFCGTSEVNDLMATGTAIKWYNNASSGTSLSGNNALVSNTYYVTQTVGGCESLRSAINVSANQVPVAPTATNPQAFCGSGTVASLTSLLGTAVKWYTTSNAGAALTSTTALVTATYYASQTVSGCESSRTSVNVYVNPIPVAPTVVSPQIFCGSGTVFSLAATGNVINWYNTNNDGAALSNDYKLINGATYYASQTVNGCEGPRASVAVSFNLTKVLYVKEGGTGNGLSWADASSDLQLMINQACPNTEIWVAAGTHNPNRPAYDLNVIYTGGGGLGIYNAFVLKADVKIYGGFPATGNPTMANRNWTTNLTKLTGYYSLSSQVGLAVNHVVISAGDVGTAELNGFTITEGDAVRPDYITLVNGIEVKGSGGGGMAIVSSSPTISNCTFSGNRAYKGAGMSVFSSSPTINNCTFSGNQAYYYSSYDGTTGGGGMSVLSSNLSISNCTFTGNAAQSNGGGVLAWESSLSLENCTFSGNNANYGGGIVNYQSSFPNVSNCILSGNTATYGGGMVVSNVGNTSINNFIFSGNNATYGGGMYLLTDNILFSNVKKCAFLGNIATYGGGIYSQANNYPDVDNCVFSGNAGTYGGAMYGTSDAQTIYNCTFSGNKTETGFLIDGATSYVYVANSIVYNNSGGLSSTNRVIHSVVQGGFVGAGNINMDPLFVNAPSHTLAPFTNGNYRLQVCSPAINKGNNESVFGDIPTAIDGAVRIQGIAVDMGAYEFSGGTNGNPNVADFLAVDVDAASATINGITKLLSNSSACREIATILPNGNHAVSGTVNAKVFIDATVKTYPYMGQSIPAVQRHYDITPESNAATATAQLTLFYTQAEFDAYNVIASDPSKTLPKNANDALGKRRLRILQYHGGSLDGSGSPTSYTGATTLITPDEDKIVWNSNLQRWEVTFNVEGFSGFFLGVDPLEILPVKLLSFAGYLANGVSLQWQVAGQQNIEKYIIERSVDGNRFYEVGRLPANEMLNATYSFVDITSQMSASQQTLYYRLRILYADGTFTYSNIITFRPQRMALTLSPNPARNEVWLYGADELPVGSQAIVTDLQGRPLQRINIGGSPQRINTSMLAAGIYFIKLNNQTLRLLIEK